MAERKGILNAALKALLAGAEVSAPLKILVTFISEIASLPEDKRKELAGLSQEQFDELLTQSELATIHAATTAVDTKQLKKMVANSFKLTKKQLAALTTLTQKELKEISDKLDGIDVTTKDTNRETKEIRAIVEEMAKNQSINLEIKEAVEYVFMQNLNEKDVPECQWPEKLQEVAKRHQELLDKWQTFESVDPQVDKFREQAHAVILNGDYDKADKLFEQAVDIDKAAVDIQKQDIQARQESLDKRQLSLAQSLAAQADLAKTKLDYNKAIDLYEQALDILPPDEQETQAVLMINLGDLYHTLAKYEKVEPLIKRALEIFEKTLNKDNPFIATALNNLANLYKDTNRLGDAEPLMERALTIDEINFGPNHPRTALRLNNLAQLYGDTNRLVEAESLMERALSIDEANFGPDHLNVAIDLNNLAALYHATNRWPDAEPMMKRVAEIFEKSYGKSDPNVSTALNNLAQLYQATNRLAEAEPMMKRALAIDTNNYGKDHPDVATDLINLAQLYQDTNRLTEAEPLMKRVLEIFIDFTRRTKHPHRHLMAVFNNYAGLLVKIGDSKDQARAKVIAMAPDLFNQ